MTPTLILIGNRDYLIDILDEIEEELSIEPFSDAYINGMIGHLSVKSSSDKKVTSGACGAEEADCVASAIRSTAIRYIYISLSIPFYPSISFNIGIIIYNRVLANFSQPGNSVSVWLASNISKLSQECIDNVTCTSGLTCSLDLIPRVAAVDLCFAIRYIYVYIKILFNYLFNFINTLLIIL
jgi:hypothetical protein